MHTATRFPIERYAAIDRAIRSGRHPNARSIARELEVSPRTVQRDIERLRLHHGAPIAYVPERHGYAYTDPNFRLACSDLTEGELLALLLAERVLQQYRGTPYAEVLAAAFARLSAGLDARVTIDLSHLGGLQSFRTTAPADIEPGRFETLLAAIRDRRRLEFAYWSASTGRQASRRVDPYHLASVDGQWYLIGYCHDRKAVRMFAPGRIRGELVVGPPFEAARDFNLDAYLAGAFAVVRGDGPGRHVVRLRFTGEAARLLRDRRRHPSQRVERSTEEELILAFELADLREVARWALSWGGDCEVLEPPELRDRVSSELKRALLSYRFATTAQTGRAAPRDRAPRGRAHAAD